MKQMESKADETEEIRVPETSVNFHRTTQWYILVDTSHTVTWAVPTTAVFT
jgi:hypothetical protein